MRNTHIHKMQYRQVQSPLKATAELFYKIYEAGVKTSLAYL